MAPRLRLLIAPALLLVLTACEGSPGAPSPSLVVSTADPIVARIVTCATCTEGPTSWAVAEFDVTLRDAGGGGGTVAFVEAVVRNRTRGTEIGRNRRPNADAGLGETTLPAGGALTTPMGVRLDLPPPRDDIQVTITVGLTNGRTASTPARLAVS